MKIFLRVFLVFQSFRKEHEMWMYQRLYPDGGGFVVLLTSILLTHRIYVTVCAMQDFCRVERSPVRNTLLFMSFGTHSRIPFFVTSPLLSMLSAWSCKGKKSLPAEGVVVGACAAPGVDTPLARFSQTYGIPCQGLLTRITP